MTSPAAPPRRPPGFRPRFLDALKGYNRERLLKDVGAGVTVGVVALPLAMAFAIASGLKPEAGLFTAIIAGLLISLLGGSRVQIGGPAGAFIVIVYGIVDFPNRLAIRESPTFYFFIFAHKPLTFRKPLKNLLQKYEESF